MRLKYWSHTYGTNRVSEGFEADDEEGRCIGGIQPTDNGKWGLVIAGEAFHPSDYTSSTDLRQMAMVIDHLNGELDGKTKQR